MSQRERDLLQVLHEARRGRLTQKHAAEHLKLSERWVESGGAAEEGGRWRAIALTARAGIEAEAGRGGPAHIG
jgi:hypothetical protein